MKRCSGCKILLPLGRFTTGDGSFELRTCDSCRQTW